MRSRRAPMSAYLCALFVSLVLALFAHYCLTLPYYMKDATIVGLVSGVACGIWTAIWLGELGDDLLARRARKNRRR